ncbi:class I SAM-dependent methyltransferase [Bradyrhizobium sp. 168]|uniref:class I SAM-dependent methyltransferase n=1 Tax=Bradyrhizobium sp. 168 TaxID=2782639 RepID=UPI001FF9CA8E|nr:class I SAM-dependent methyltransferase [Bradyrhizobium sp. 168]MCK1583262.1 class I SAM-dependent methyltransferase [Bradyrhizobium sp. 168]
MVKAAVDTYSPFDTGLKSTVRRNMVLIAAKLGLRLERLEDTSRFVADGSAKITDLYEKAVSIPGMVSLKRGQIMYYMALSTAHLGGDILEIGSWQGRSTLFLAQACKDSETGSVHAVDTFKGNPGNESLYVVGKADRSDLLPNFLQNMKAAGVADRVTPHAMSSVEARSEIKAINPSFRLIYIDGEHTYDAVKADLHGYADLLQVGGLLLFDDYSISFPGVVKAIDEHIAENPGRYGRRIQDDNLLVLRRIS